MATATETETAEAEERADIEARARRYGWKPKEQFGGKPELWVDAPEFIQRTEQSLPLARQANAKLEREVAELKRTNETLVGEVRETKQTLDEFRTYATRGEQRAYERAKRELQDRLATQTAAGDVAGVTQTASEIAALEREAPPAQRREEPPPPPDKKSAEQRPQIAPEVLQWTQDNPIIWNDPVLNPTATALHGEYLRTKPGLTLTQNLEEVKHEIMRRFPERFGNPRRMTPAAVEPPASGGPPPKGDGRQFKDLPEDAKAAFRRWKKQIPTFTEEEYLAQYDWSA